MFEFGLVRKIVVWLSFKPQAAQKTYWHFVGDADQNQ